MSHAQDILRFWFGELQTNDAAYAQRRSLWFGKRAETDQIIRDRFLGLHRQAAAGELDHWQDNAASCLALIVLLDQFSRNLFRASPQAFETDAKGLAVAKEAIALGFDQQQTFVERLFMYLPLEHSEHLDDQQRCVELMQQLAIADPKLADCYEYAVRHLKVIQEFGRFPHRNAVLGRETTPAEAEFLKQPGSSF